MLVFTLHVESGVRYASTSTKLATILNTEMLQGIQFNLFMLW